MATNKGNINNVIDIQAVKSQIDYLQTSLIKITDQFGEIAVAIDKMNGKLKNASTYKEINDALNNNAENHNKVAKAAKEHNRVTEALAQNVTLLDHLQNGLGEKLKENVKTNLKIIDQKKELTKEAKKEYEESKKQVLTLEELISNSKRQVDSIKAIVEENKKLKAIRDSLDTNTQVAEIESLNQKIDKNTSIIKANTDAASQQKMNIGNYKSAVEGLQLTLAEITAQMANMASKGDQNSAEFAELKNQAAQTEKQIADFAKTISELDSKGGSLREKMKKMRFELAQMALDGKENTEEFKNMAKEAAHLEDTIGDVNQQVKNMASDTQVFEGISSALSGLAGGLEAGVGLWGLTIGKTEEFEAIMKNVASAIAITNGLQSVSAMLAEESAAKTLAAKAAEWIGYNKVIASQTLSVALTNAETAAGGKLSIVKKTLIALQWAWNKALYSNPLVLFIGLLAAAGAGVYYLGKAFGWWGNSNKEAKESLKALNEEFQKTKKLDEDYLEVLKARKTTQEEIISQTIALRKNEFAKTEEILNKTGALYRADTEEYKAALEQKQKASEDYLKSQMDAQLLLESIMADVNNAERKKAIGDEAFSIEQVKAKYQALFDIIDNQLDIDPFKKAEYASAVMKKAEMESAEIAESFRKDREKKAEEERKKQEDSHKKELDDIEKRYQEEQRIIEEAEKEKISDKQAYYDFVKKMSDKQKESLSQETQQSLLTISRNQENEMKLLDDQLKNKLISVEDYEKRKNDILYKYSQEAIQIAIDEAKKQLEILNLTEGEKLSIKQKLIDLEKQLREGDTEHFRENETVKKEFKIETDEEALEYAKGINDQLTAISDTIFNGQMAKLDAEAKRDEELKAAELERAGNNQAMKDQIEAKYSAKAKQREQERRKLEIQKAKQDKALGIINAIINTALGIAKTIGTMGMPLAIPFIALTAALGAAQVAAIASQPIPQYFKGREDGPAELAIVGERGSEGIELPGGKTYLTPSRPTLTFLPEHAKVIPHEELLQAAGALAMTPISRLPESYGHDYHELKNEIAGLKAGFDKVVKAINDKQELHINITERGLQAAAQRGANFTRYLNQNVRL